jgi:hypothetical protein
MNMRQGPNKAIPLLYIQQPYLDPPKAKMQKQFIFQEKPEPIFIHVEPEEPQKSNEKNEEKPTNENDQAKKSKESKKDLKIDKHDNKVEKEDQQSKLEKNDQIIEIKLAQQQATDPIEVPKRELQQTNKRVPFNELPLEEKFNYIKAVPMSTAKIRFEFITSEGGTSGYFLSNKGDVIHILKMESNETITLPLHSIIDIRMIGI